MLILSAVYWLTIRLYAISARIASIFNPKAKLFIEGRKQLLQRISEQLANEARPRIWMHCASLGEFEQGRPVLEKLQQQYPEYSIVLSFFSPSGYEVRKNYEGADHVFYLPLDNRYNAKHFLQIVKPALCIFVKYELWYYYLSAIAKQHIPAILISARFRKNKPFFKFYGALHRKMLRCFTGIFVQDNVSAALLQDIDILAIVNGDTRFDRVIEASQQEREMPIAATFCEGKKILIAGSTWKEDEVFLQKAFALLPSDWKMIIVPHEVDEPHIREVEKLFAGDSVGWTQWKNDNKRVLIVDKVGLLLQLYRYGNVAWIGGGFGKEGVHNVLEAAVYGKPCAFGPIFHQFIEAEELIQVGGAVTVNTPDEFVTLINQWEQQAFEAGVAAKEYVYSKSGATTVILNYISEKKLLSTL